MGGEGSRQRCSAMHVLINTQALVSPWMALHWHSLARFQPGCGF